MTPFRKKIKITRTNGIIPSRNKAKVHLIAKQSETPTIIIPTKFKNKAILSPVAF
jgi:hypothetical protein